MCFFFFSSRRRHTRFDCDWSSDVCSSDLNSRRALLHILQDSHQDKRKLEASRKAMIHIMGDLRETTAEMQRREQELRDKQEQLVQVGKLATLGELITGVAHELNNPLNNIGLFVGNAVDLIELGVTDKEQ